MNKDKILKLASLVLDFGRIDRQTYHQDGLTKESDTDHSMMLIIVCCALASKLYKDIDIGLLAQFASVHDLVEVYALDTPTLVIDDIIIKNKEKKEKEAFVKIKSEFGEDFSWIDQTIEKYEKLDSKEARFVKVVDKILPKITVVLNKAKGINDNKLATRGEATKTFDVQREKIKMWASDMPELVELWEFFVSEELKLIKE